MGALLFASGRLPHQMLRLPALSVPGFRTGRIQYSPQGSPSYAEDQTPDPLLVLTLTLSTCVPTPTQCLFRAQPLSACSTLYALPSLFQNVTSNRQISTFMVSLFVVLCPLLIGGREEAQEKLPLFYLPANKN